MSEDGQELSDKQIPIEKPREIELRQSLITLAPESVSPKTARDLDWLVIAQLAENLKQQTGEFITKLPDNTPAYALPCEFRLINGRYQALIPRVADWHFRRKLPIWGNHPPFAETYGFNRNEHPFQEKFQELSGIKDLVDYCQETKNDPLIIGQGLGKTPFHRFYWTGDRLVIELQSCPLAGQTLALNDLKERLSRIVPTEIITKNQETFEPIPKDEEVLEKLQLTTTVNVSYNHQLTAAHIAAVSPEGNLIMDRHPPPKNLKTIVGFGYFYDQMEAKGATLEGSLNTLTFHLDFNARNHEEAKGSFALQRLASWQLNERQEKEGLPYSKLGTTLEETAVQLEEQLRTQQPKEFEATDLGVKWPFRPEILDEYLPFKLNVEGLIVPCGYRAEINPEDSVATLELLVTEDALDSPAKKALLQRVVQQQAKALAQRLSFVPDKEGKWLKINHFQGKIFEVKV